MCLNEAYIPHGQSSRRNIQILAEAARRFNLTERIINMSEISDELEQNQRWWEREYEALKQRCFPPKPFDPAQHDGHELIEVSTYTSEPTFICTQCRQPKDY